MANSRLCSIPNCGKPRIGRGWCEGHYRRWRKHGDPHAGMTSPGAPRRFIEETALPFRGDDCLTWPFARYYNGYGVVRVGGHNHVASRYICTLVHGDAPQGFEAAHSCGNGNLGCINPRHLSWKSPIDNAADREQHGTQPRGEKVPGSKLSEWQVKKIRSMAGSHTQQSIADAFGVSRRTVGFILKGETWKHVA